MSVRSSPGFRAAQSTASCSMSSSALTATEWRDRAAASTDSGVRVEVVAMGLLKQWPPTSRGSEPLFCPACGHFEKISQSRWSSLSRPPGHREPEPGKRPRPKRALPSLLPIGGRPQRTVSDRPAGVSTSSTTEDPAVDRSRKRRRPERRRTRLCCLSAPDHGEPQATGLRGSRQARPPRTQGSRQPRPPSTSPGYSRTATSDCTAKTSPESGTHGSEENVPAGIEPPATRIRSPSWATSSSSASRSRSRLWSSVAR